MTRRRCPLATLLSVVSCFVGCTLVHAGSLYIDPLYGYSKTADIQYGTGATTGAPFNLLLDVYQPVDIGLGRVQSNRPAVVIQDGGAWTSGEKDNGRVVTPAIYLAQRGYTVFIADYRQVGDSAVSGPGPWQNLNISGNGSTMGGLVSIYPSKNVIRAAIEDFATAMTYVRSNATTYGINPNLIAAAGGSAGAVDVLDLQYNNNPVNPAYAAQAVLSLVGTMYGDWDRVQAGGPPLFMLNNALDPVIWYGPDVSPNLHNRLLSTGIYFEQWMQEPNLTDHNVHYEQHPTANPVSPFMTQWIGDTSKDVLERMRDFLANHFNSGPVEIAATPVISVTSIDSQTVWNVDKFGVSTAVATPANGLLGPVGATHDAAGNLYVSDFLQGKIYKINTTDQVSTFAANAGTLTPTGLTVDGSGHVLVDNYLLSKVNSLDSSGNATLLADAAKGISEPFATAVNTATGDIYVANVATKQIIKIDSSGNASVFADAGDGLLTPVSLAVNAAGEVFVGDALLSKVFKFTPAGVGSVFADLADGVVTPTGLDIDAAGKLYVANYLGNNVLQFAPDGVGSVYAIMNRPFGVSAVTSPLPLGPSFAPVPEPATWALAVCGFAVLLLFYRVESSKRRTAT